MSWGFSARTKLGQDNFLMIARLISMYVMAMKTTLLLMYQLGILNKHMPSEMAMTILII